LNLPILQKEREENDMAEKNILAYFRSPEEAENAARKLESIRVLSLSIDRFSRYAGNSYDYSNVISDTMRGLGYASYSGFFGIANQGVLSAADPSSSGMSHGGAGGPTGYDVLLTVVVDDTYHHQALRIIEEAGGKI
jgi:hypothetical protein